jgi:hypothetical protein
LITNSLNALRRRLELAWANLLARSNLGPVVIFESDDWGTIRLRDRQAFDAMQSNGLELSRSPYNTFDCLERREDLESLIDTLSLYRNRNGEHPSFTLNTVLCNPIFEKIAGTGFEEYHSESLFESYQRYYGQDLSQIWKDGILRQLIHPQFHAREHLNVYLWMRDLARGLEPTRFAFRHGFFSLRTKTSSPVQRHYVAAFSPDCSDHFEAICCAAKDGLNRFEAAFGFRSKTFIGCNYVWPVELEPILFESGIVHLQTRLKRFAPNFNQRGKRTVMRHFTGQRNPYGQSFGVRNVLFEPYLDPAKDWVTSALRQIEHSFFFKAPAIVCTHRINYCSHINRELPKRALYLLSELLRQITRRWPDIRFLTSASLADTLQQHMKSTPRG